MLKEGGENMGSSDTRENVINICAYFYEVLIKKFLELEKAVHSQSGLLSLFKKINYKDRANAFNGLLERAIEAKDELSSIHSDGINPELYSLLTKLTECMAIYVNMVKVQVEINENLNLKANGEKYDWNEYSKGLQFFEMLRSGLETELPKLQSLYSAILGV